MGGLLDRYGVVVFDCDGVLLDSNNLKSSIFRQVLARHGYEPAEIDAFTVYQRQNFGLSRYRLFAEAAAGRFGPARPTPAETLIEDFGALCRVGYLEQPETPGMREAIARAGADGRALYVVSGSDEAELREVLAARGMADAFAAIYGSPTPKVDNMRRVAAERGGAPILFVGDAEADMNAATAVGADFVFMAGFSTVRPTLEPRARAAGFPVIEDLRALV